MPRYFCHSEAPHAVRDTEGRDLADHQEARCVAMRILCDLACEDPALSWEAHAQTLRVANASDLTLFQVDVMTTKSAALV